MKLPSVYEPGQHEAKIYQLWEQSGAFKADPTSSKPRFSLSMPPPNETGSLHAGHAIGMTIEDIMVRHARQTGHDALWLPGTDHAALATNAIIERRLTEQGADKHAIGREEFLRITREFVADSRQKMNAQIKALGASCDWSRTRYTLDDALNRLVNEVFVRMYNDGLVYRGSRIVNWDPKLETTVSDDEVIHKEEKAPLYTLQFGPFQIVTARPETKFGDKYVVMHPDDKRYAMYQDGQQLEVEWINGKITATVVKDEAVEPEFGTGVMTITPWHDHTDFEIAERHGLEEDQVIGFDGKLLPLAGEFAGLDITKARPKIVEKLKSKGLLVEIDENYLHSIGLNDRGKGVIEPQIMLQWFVDVNRPAVDWKGQKRSFKEIMRAVIDDGDIELVPGRFNNLYFHWIDNLRDWNISRQIWWGHRVPIWYKNEQIFCGVQEPAGQGWEQDPDTLDTWFSSALWTWSTLVDPQLAADFNLSLEELLAQSVDFQTYHPTSVLETGWDILFFWVARMILATTYATGQVPFSKVYLHGLVRTEAGKKMSKSDPEGSIDPLEMISEYGADALRLALITGISAGTDQRLGRAKIIGGRNFCNKLWNVARYAEPLIDPAKDAPAEPESPADHWILNMLSNCAGDVSADIENFRFGEAYERLYHFVWDDLADWYIEASKTEPNPELLRLVLQATLVMAHPFIPFLSETIWQELGLGEQLLAITSAPSLPKADPELAENFGKLRQVISQIRHIETVLSVRKPKVYYDGSPWLADNSELVIRLARLGSLEKLTKSHSGGLKLTGIGADIWLDVDRASADAYLARLKDQRAETENALERLKKRLASKDYVGKAPAELVEQTKEQAREAQSLLDEIEAEIKTFSLV